MRERQAADKHWQQCQGKLPPQLCKEERAASIRVAMQDRMQLIRQRAKETFLDRQQRFREKYPEWESMLCDIEWEVTSSAVQKTKRDSGEQTVTIYTCRKCGKQQTLNAFWALGCAAAPATAPPGRFFAKMNRGDKVSDQEINWKAPSCSSSRSLRQLQLEEGANAGFYKGKGHLVQKAEEQDRKLRNILRKKEPVIAASLCEPDFANAKYEDVPDSTGRRRILLRCQKCSRTGSLFHGRSFKYVEISLSECLRCDGCERCLEEEGSWRCAVSTHS
jgi:hypothetical protein